jgi:hypothetical protein
MEMVVVIAETKRTTTLQRQSTEPQQTLSVRGRIWPSATSLFAPAILQIWQCSQHKRSFKGQVTRAGTEFLGEKNQATTTCPRAAF